MAKTKVIGVVRDAGVRKAGVDYPIGTLILANGTANLPTGQLVVIATGQVKSVQEPWTPDLSKMGSVPSWK